MRFVKRRGTKASTVSPFLNVTWAEIEKAKREGKEEMEFELENIDENAKPNMLDVLIGNNVEYLLREEELLPPGARVIIPAPGVDYECEPAEGAEGVLECRFSGGFEVFDELGWNELGSGYVAGKMYYDEDADEFTLLGINASLSTEDVEKLKRIAEKAKK